MATALIQSEAISFDQNILTVINDLKKKENAQDIQDRKNILLINETLINKINRNLNSYSVKEANTNSKYGTSQVLSSNLYFANSTNNSTCDSSVTPQTPLKGSEAPSTKSIPDLTIGLLTPTEKMQKLFLQKKHRHNDTI